MIHTRAHNDGCLEAHDLSLYKLIINSQHFAAEDHACSSGEQRGISKHPNNKIYKGLSHVTSARVMGLSAVGPLRRLQHSS
jgi:hypothetical protein